MASEDFDKFVGLSTKNVLQNWGRIVAENIKNNLNGIKPLDTIPMDVALEKYLGVELTPEEKEYFKDKVLTDVYIPDDNFTDTTDHKLTVKVNYVKYDPEE